MRARFLSCSGLVLGSALLGGGCSEIVALGSQCPESDQDSCLVVADAAGPPSTNDAQPPAVIVDANTPPERVVDGGSSSAPDSATPPMGPIFPAIGNAGFELYSGVPGDVTTLSQTDIMPWYTCQPIGLGSNPTTAVRAESSVVLTSNETPAGATVLPPDGSGTFISMQYLVNIVPLPLLQTLSAPLQPNTRYAFELSVQATNPSAQLSLQVRGTGTDDCLNLGQSEVMAETDSLATPGWQTVCLSFMPAAEHSHLLFTIRSAAPLSNAFSGARLLFDNIRPTDATDCPGL